MQSEFKANYGRSDENNENNQIERREKKHHQEHPDLGAICCVAAHVASLEDNET